MTELLKNLTLIEVENQTSEGRIEMAAATTMLEAVSLLNRALTASGKSQKYLADQIGVGESRVSQVLNGDGNIRMSTLSRYLRALGYVVRLDAEPADQETAPLPARRAPRRRRTAISPTVVYQDVVEHNNKITNRILIVEHDVPVDARKIEPTRRLGSVDYVNSRIGIHREAIQMVPTKELSYG
ncbi:helix-turn-helix domain-containing protein [Agreia pratensis]|uniref:Helix-turn-helix n=1 Tax=Agreia pratensis TaxID=150121 RepID=A0A1X7K2B8_9MICO|nr:helix-turn-helix transcriptional regulator [Agreia pratensis]SMG34816.1 Helix-turn-helix [Agreia pratensis]